MYLQRSNEELLHQKTYAEHVTMENLEPIDSPYWEIKCAGMPETCKRLFMFSFNPAIKTLIEKGIAIHINHKDLTPDEQLFLSQTRSILDFKFGLKVPGKLMPKHIEGGIVLQSDYYTMKRSNFFL